MTSHKFGPSGFLPTPFIPCVTKVGKHPVSCVTLFMNVPLFVFCFGFFSFSVPNFV